MNDTTKGLAGVTAGETAISTVGKDNVGLTYRGYSIQDLASYATFEEVAYLLIYERLPTADELAHYVQLLSSLRSIPVSLQSVLHLIPATAHPMDVLRTGCSFLGNIEPENKQRNAIEVANRLIACLPSMLLTWYHFHQQQDFKVSVKNLTTADFFLQGLHGEKPSDLMAHALDVSLVLYAEHEFNASTFSARVTAATLSDVYSTIISAIGTLRGALHGGANEKALTLIESFSTVEAARAGILQRLEDKSLIMGFGHRVYRDSDPRSDIIKALAKQLADTDSKKNLFAIAEAIEETMWQQKHLFPNVDFYSALVYKFLDIPQAFFTPLFVMSRVTGWMAHVIEQRDNNRLIRPDARYIGPEQQSFPQLKQRESLL